MTDWTVAGPLDAEPFRWLNHRGRLDWVADEETTRVLTAPGGFSFAATPTGPWIDDATGDEASLYAAALHLIAGDVVTGAVFGDPPQHPGVRARVDAGAGPSVVY